MWFVYIIQSLKDNSYYTGITIDLDKRLETHNKGKGSKYTRGRISFVLVHSEKFETKSEALKREYQIKQLSKLEKEKLINSNS